MADSPCQGQKDCAPGFLCPNEVGQCRQACSIEPFVDAPTPPLICADDCPNGAGMPIERTAESDSARNERGCLR